MKAPLLGIPLVLTAALCATTQTNYAADAFVLDPDRSEVTLNGTMAGTTAGEQGPGSLTSKLSGTLLVEATASTIHFPGGSALDAEASGPWQPDVDGASGSALADFAGQALGSAVVALRDVVMDVVTAQPLALTGGQFAAKDIQFVFPTGGSAAMDYRISIPPFFSEAARESLEGITTNKVATTGSLVEAGGLLTLTIPLNATYSFDLVSPDDSSLSVQGQLVATRVSSGPAEPSLGEVRVEGGSLVFAWSSEEGQTFTVLQSSGLGAWVPVEQDYPAQPGGTTTWSVPIQNQGTAFFLIRRP